MPKKVILVLNLFILAHWPGFCADEREVYLGEIVITPFRYAKSSQHAPYSLEVISQEEIEESNARTVIDVLRSKTGIIVRDYFGTGVQAMVDLRGFGETGNLNTLVLVDGRKINEIDLSGVSWTQIPLEAVEKIEIIRGAGGVLYGDGAVGGVINIITRSGQEKVKFLSRAEGGSYRMNKQTFLSEGTHNGLSFSLGVTNHSTNGYRRNSEYKGIDSWTNLSYQAADNLTLHLNNTYHNADFGLPGALREAQIANLSRTQSLLTEDHVAEEDWYINAGFEYDFEEYGICKTNLSFRRRKIENTMLNNLFIDGRRIDTITLRSQYILENQILSKDNSLTAGVDLYQTDAIIDTYSFAGLAFYNTGQKVTETDIDKNALGIYIHDVFALTDDLDLTGGARYERAKYKFNYRQLPGPWTADFGWGWFAVAPISGDLSVNEKAYDFGCNYRLNDDASLFFNYSRSFRFPATDEYFSVWATPPINTNLKHQKSHNYNLGLNSRLFDNLNARLTLFWMNVKNELFYNPVTFANTNYDNTIHRGVEASLEYEVTDYLTLMGDYVYTKAFSDGGAFDHNQLPLVPYHAANFGFRLNFDDRFSLKMLGNYVGSRYLISDQPHNFPKLDEHVTVDLQGQYQFKNFRIFAGVNNLFDQEYSEIGAISLVFGQRGFFPSPERNFMAGVEIEF